MSIEELPKEIVGVGEVKGIVFKKIRTDDFSYIYERSDGTFEVIKRKIVPKCLDFEKRLYSETEFKEVYPKASKFGIDGFAYTLLPNAIRKQGEMYSAYTYGDE